MLLMSWLRAAVSRWRHRGDVVDRAVVALALALGGLLGTVIAFGRREPDFGDEATFLRLADNLLTYQAYTSDGVSPTAWKPPLEAWFLAPFVWVFDVDGAVLPARLTGLALYLIAAFLLWRSCRSLGRPGVGVFVALGMSLSPAGLVVATSLYPQGLVIFLVVAGFAVTVSSASTTTKMLTLGGLGGLAVLGHATSAIPLAVMLVMTAWTAGHWRQRTVAALAGLTTLSVVVVPWVLRNSVVMGAPTLATGAGDNLLRGNNPLTTPQSGVNVDLTQVVTLPEGITEAEVDTLLRDAALSWIAANPLDALWLYVQKLGYFFAASNTFASDVEASALEAVALSLAWFPVLMLAVLRLLSVRAFPLAPAERVAAWSVLWTAVGTALFFSRVRYRITVDPFVLLLAGMMVSHLLQRFIPTSRAGDQQPEATTAASFAGGTHAR